MITDFQDKFGLVHHKRPFYGDPETSENSPMFSAMYLLMELLTGETLDFNVLRGMQCLLSDNMVWRPTPVSSEDSHLSHDNCLGINFYRVVAEREFLPYPQQRTRSIFIHPRDWMIGQILTATDKKNFYLWCLEKMTNLNDPAKNSSSPHRWFLTWHLLWVAGKINIERLTRILNLNDTAYWFRVFSNYYKSIEHPTVEKLSKINRRRLS